MAVYGNFKGTTQPGFTVGKTGAATIHGNPATAPTSPLTGDVWMDSANTALKVYDGSDWSQGTFIGNLEGFIEVEVVAGENLSKGDVVYVSGSSGNTPQVSKAQANSGGTKMPAIGIAKQTINSGNRGYVVVQGLLTGINTSTFSEGDVLYVNSTVAGAFTSTAPSGEENKIQNVGKVINSSNGGSILVTGAGRFNATSALDSGNIFIGNGSNQAVTASLDTSIGDLGFLKNVVEDTTPELGGDLDALDNGIRNLDLIRINTDGQGLRMTSVGAFDNTGGNVAGNFRIFATNDLILGAGGTGNAVVIDKTTKDTTFAGTITVHDAFTFPSADGLGGQVLQTDGSGAVIWATPSSSVVGGYVYTQASAATTWTINHNLGTQYINVEVIDDTGNSLVGTSNYPDVNFTSGNVTTLTFSTATAGYAALTSGGGQTGATGFTGSQGFTGSASTVIGFTGSKGDQGDVGFTGSTGIGFTGSAGSQGLIGFTGSQGDQGLIGFTGSKGDQGDTGFTGSKGDTGFTGSKGDTGFNGSVGFVGSQGGFGGATFEYDWSTSTTVDDPGAGTVKINNANLTSGTILSIDDTDANGTDIQQFLRTIDDSTSAIKGHFRMANKLNANDFALYTISAISEETDYFEVTVAYVDGSATSFTNGEELIMTFARTGDKGDTGFTGSTGATGFTGSKGDTGFTGSRGDTGFTGSKGDQGLQGFTGSEGAQGLIGFTGSKGDQGDIGFTGSKGDQGDIGYTGSKGDIGFTGSKGDTGFTGSTGSKGDLGNTGFTGSEGDQGFTGSKGDQGDTGFTGSIGNVVVGGAFVHTQSAAATTWTVNHNLDAQYLNVEVIDVNGNSMVGTYGYPSISFTNANTTTLTFTTSTAGYASFTSGGGQQGTQGGVGFTGSKGNQGNVGFTGSKGDQGDIGFTGSKGDQGITGFTGSAGGQGLIGFTGSKGDQGDIGFTGSKGDQGDVGFTGSKGDTGFTGSKGDQGDIGFTGSAGGQGLIGFTGSKGDQGDIGFTGSKGDIGFTGSKGDQGDIGFTGSKGDIGFGGSIGFTGSQGGFGGATFEYDWSTDTALSDPGTGVVKINNANLTAGTILSIDDEDANGTDIQQFLRTIDDSSSAIKGHFRMANKLDASDFALYTISAISEETGYFEVTVAYIEGSATSFTNGEELIMTFARTGDKGDTGFTGSKGDIGFTGSKGDTGFNGSRGDTGFTGSIGDQGIQGFTGSKGDQGLIGFTGSKGDQGDVGFTGSKGDQGDVGFTGSKGDQGDVGFTGSKGDTGFTGSKGDQGLIGFTGSKGDQGLIGFTGSKGDQGDIGFTGSKGDTVVAGAYVHTQSAAANTWTITHNLDSQYLNVEVIDSSGNSLTGTYGFPTIAFTSANTTTLTFTTPTAGYVALSSGGGQQGTTGYVGSQGDAGFAGSRGIQGLTGFNGSRGDLGFTGSGSTEPGPVGSRGFTGSIGFAGSTGGIGFSGSEGPQGDQGIQGPQGFNGSTGFNGSVGFSGSEGAQGPTGPTGNVGFDGSTGSTGFGGSKGDQGDIGFTGSQSSVQGPPGFTGSKGDQGLVGFTGSKGDQGLTGFTGSKGDTGFNGSAGAENATLDSVTDNGSITTNSITTGGVQTTVLTTGSNATAGTVTGDWTLTAGSTWEATYADLAEKYTTDGPYEAGTVMMFGGEAELTQSDKNNDTRVAGVISDAPAFTMNGGIDGQYLALSGRVPVKVVGTVTPGDLLVASDTAGHAIVNNTATTGTVIGKAITSDANGVCEAIVTLM
jgi:hypothetical protein